METSPIKALKKQMTINYNTRFFKNSIPLQKLLKIPLEDLENYISED